MSTRMLLNESLLRPCKEFEIAIAREIIPK